MLAYPLYNARAQALTVNASALDDLLAERDGVYATLRDLEMDQQLGKLDAADYRMLRERYMTRATEILQQLDALRGEGAGQAASAEIEKEVAALRGRTITPPAGPVPDEGRTSSQKPSSSIGRPLSDLRCGNCGRPYKKGDQFCARCGRALS